MATSLIVNGRPRRIEGDGDRLLLTALRTDLALTGTKYGCGEGLCGACTVLVDGRPAHACRTRLADVDGRHVTTVEGLAEGGRLHPLQQAFVEHGALQCGYCTSGMLLTAVALLAEHPHPTRAQIVARMDPVLCRCGAHLRIVAAIEQVAAAAPPAGRRAP